MFAKLRRKHRSAAAPTPSPAPSLEPPASVLETADHRVVARAERIRTALQEAGADLDSLGPEPAWLAVAGTQSLPLGDFERAELIAYLGSATTKCVSSDEECAKALTALDTYVAHRELARVGLYVENCSASLPAAALRTLRDRALEAQLPGTEDSASQLPQAP
ncbi:hypothetical protein ABR738_00505 [Streptomyces sp. Edi4]|uniref:hypothetical protein n=1 Tax=Streptomyces sp. Edi4 TaxID=3162527 RepID=UPI003305F2C1